ncbi:MAG: glycosyltransferase family 2 protein [Oscillospiraceae bacterium]|nr:glycosyltransferase family 2 protein [Oscillospiraceae bacterium]
MKKTVSIIVPIYNVEDYLPRCVDSILRQTYSDLEIILVDDGSPDSCGAICDAYAKKDSRIRVIHKPNGGLSDARNAGLDIATGDYVYFVDSDDWIADDAITSLMMRMDDTVDIVMGSSVDVREVDGKILETAYSIPLGSLREMDRLEAMKDDLLGGWAAWNKLYKRMLFQTIRFPVGKINEDEAILLHILDLCDRVIQVGHPTYYYFLRPNSITTSSFSEKKMDWFHNCVANYGFIQEAYPQLLPEAEYRLMSSVQYLLQFMLLEHKRFSDQILQLQSCLDEKYRSILRNPYTTKEDRKRLRLFKIVLRWKLGWIYRTVYGLYRKLR